MDTRSVSLIVNETTVGEFTADIDFPVEGYADAVSLKGRFLDVLQLNAQDIASHLVQASFIVAGQFRFQLTQLEPDGRFTAERQSGPA